MRAILFVVIGSMLGATVPAHAQIFADGFESGDTSAWLLERQQVPGLLDVNAQAALDGDFGLEIHSGGSAWVATLEPANERTLGVSFFFSDNNWEMIIKAVDILRFNQQGSSHHVRLNLSQAGPGLFRLGLLVRTDNGAYEAIGGGLIASATVNLVEVQWRAASTPGGADGSAALLINGVLEARAPNLMNGQFDVRSIQLGVMRAPGAQTKGDIYLDTFESFRLTAR